MCGSGSPRWCRSTAGLTVATLVVLTAVVACRRPAPPTMLADTSWDEVRREARGQSVTWMMWMGDPYVNAYVRDFVTPRLARDAGVRVRVVGGQGHEIVATLMAEKEAGQSTSAIDMLWINGETFYQLRQLDALLGPFVERLPGAAALDLANPYVSIDFQQPIAGYECPWGNVQLAWIYDGARVLEPPRTRAALLDWVRAHPGRFTFDSSFTGMTLLKGWLVDIAGGAGALAGPFERGRYERHAGELWDYVRALKPYLWRRGETFPTAVAAVHQLFANGEVDFTFSNNDGEVDNKVLQGLFPPTARAYVPDEGSIRNSHYLGIPRGARNLAGALVTIDFLISPEAQLEKSKAEVWGDGTVLRVPSLPSEWRERFARLPERRHAPAREALQVHALQELAPEYMIRLYDDFRREIVER